VATARAAGYDNLGLDLIFGLPTRLERDLDLDLDRVLELEPEHVSVYGLSVEPETPLGRWVAEGREDAPDPDRYGDEYLRVAERLRGEGYVHYEVSNFARPGREAVHNAAYWQGVPYLGLGNGAHSFLPPHRWWNHRDWHAYRQAVAERGHGRAGDEEVGPEAVELERIWLSLRTADGLSRADLTPAQVDRVTEWERHGWAAAGPEKVRLTAPGWLLLDRLAVELSTAGEGDALRTTSSTTTLHGRRRLKPVNDAPHTDEA
jgi:oxygen-independent coproporphyrinogen-3 oxidase